MAKHEFHSIGNTFAASWMMCDICGKLVNLTQYLFGGVQEEECPGEPKEVETCQSTLQHQ